MAGMAEQAPQPGLPTIDVNEYGGKKEGERQAMNRRLFMELLVFEKRDLKDGAELAGRLKEAKVPSVIYADTAHPHRYGLLSWSDDPAHFVKAVRPAIAALPSVEMIPEFTMIGRTYATGHEPDLEFTLLRRPIANAMNEAYPWHIWYPLRRTGAFAKLEPQEQGLILREHATIGFAYGQQELAHDIRLACHGLDAQDNEFVIGLVGKELHPLSHLVQAMRKTKQTSEFIAKMGPFFVGYVIQRVT
jgi:chlorite dismutase